MLIKEQRVKLCIERRGEFMLIKVLSGTEI
jgi:hypothetical protein